MSKPLVLRIVLSALLCLNGSTALWASAAMALDPSHMLPMQDGGTHAGEEGDHSAAATAACQAPAATADGDCTAPLPGDPVADSDRPADHGHGSGHGDGDDCRCGAGMIGGCSCNCAYPGGMSIPTVPFAARHSLASASIPYVEVLAPRRAGSTIFRPPIG